MLRAEGCGDGEIGSAFNLPPHARLWGYAAPRAPLRQHLNCTPTPMPAQRHAPGSSSAQRASFITQCYELIQSAPGPYTSTSLPVRINLIPPASISPPPSNGPYNFGNALESNHFLVSTFNLDRLMFS